MIFFILVLPILVLLLAQAAWLLLLTIFANDADNKPVEPVEPRPPAMRVAVIIPAHNEAASIQATISAIRPQLRRQDYLIVVADNCSDDTALVASSAGATTIVRNDADRRGKGYALDFAISYLKTCPAPDVVVFVDADCILSPGSIDALARQCDLYKTPTQAKNLSLARTGADRRQRLAEFAWRIKNHIRPLGARRLGYPCHITGTGMAFPWELIAEAALATNHLVEDMKLGVELMLQGRAPTYCPGAKVTSYFAPTESGARTQRARWEQGHLSIIVEYVPSLCYAAFRQMDPRLLVMALDLSIPPVGLLAVSTALLALLGIVFGASGFAGPTVVCLTAAPLLLLAAAILIAWLRYGRDLISTREFVAAPGYAISKAPALYRFLFDRQQQWVRSARDGE